MANSKRTSRPLDILLSHGNTSFCNALNNSGQTAQRYVIAIRYRSLLLPPKFPVFFFLNGKRPEHSLGETFVKSYLISLDVSLPCLVVTAILVFYFTLSLPIKSQESSFLKEVGFLARRKRRNCQ